MKKIFQVKLSTKIIGPFIGIALIFSLFGGLIVSNWFVARLEESAKDHLEAGRVSADGAFARLETEVQNYTKVMREVAGLPTLIQNRNLPQIRQELIPQMVAFNLDFFEVLDERGEVILNNNGPYVETTSLSTLPILQGAQVDMVMVDLLDTPAGVAICGSAPIKYAGGKVGFVLTGYYLTPELLADIKKISGHDISVFTEQGLIATTMPGKPEVTCASTGCHIAGYTALISRRILKGTVVSPEYVDMLGKPYLISHGTLKLHGEPVAFYSVLMPMKELVAAENFTRLSVILLALLVMVLIIVIGFWVARRLANPLRDLSAMAKKVTKGDLTPRSNYKSKDEIGDLAASFNQMTESLQNYTDSLRRRVLELSILYDTGLATSSTFDLNTMLQAVVDNIVKALDVDYSSIMTLNDKKEELALKAGYGLDPNGAKRAKMKIGGDIPSWVAKRGEPILLNESDTIKKFGLLPTKNNITSFISVPLKIQDEVVGVINVGRGSTRRPFGQDDVHFLTTLSTQAAVAIKNVELFDDLQKSYLSIVKALAEIVDAKDHYTRGHSARVARYAAAIAKELGLSKLEADSIEIAAYLHDVGKIGISDDILLKPGKLYEEEMRVIKTHPDISAKILAPIRFPWEIVSIVRDHHERYAGGGYPDNKNQEDIHIGARILFVADAYEAMTSERPYRKALTQEEAIEELKKAAGTQFDPQVVQAFLSILETGKIPKESKKKVS